MQSNLSEQGFRETSSNQIRLEAITKLLEECRQNKVDLLLLPAGALTASSEKNIRILVNNLDELASDHKTNIIGGIDLENCIKASNTKNSQDYDLRVKKGTLPFFGFSVGKNIENHSGRIWRQRHTTSYNSVFSEIIGGKCLKLKNIKIGVFMCGELFGSTVKEKIATDKPDLIVNIGHLNMNRVITSLRSAISRIPSLKRQPNPALHTHHLTNWKTTSLLGVSGNGESTSEKISPENMVRIKNFWAAYRINQI